VVGAADAAGVGIFVLGCATVCKVQNRR